MIFKRCPWEVNWNVLVATEDWRNRLGKGLSGRGVNEKILICPPPPPPARELHGKGTMRCEGSEMKDASLNLPSKS